MRQASHRASARVFYNRSHVRSPAPAHRVFRRRRHQPHRRNRQGGGRPTASPRWRITDLNNLFGAIKFYKEARGAGVKPIIGAEIFAARPGARTPARCRAWCCWCRTSEGYLNLCELLARAWTQNVVQQAQAVCKLDWLRGARRRPDRALGRAGRAGGRRRCCRATSSARARWRWSWPRIFPHRFYIELQRAGRPDDEAHVAAAVQLAARLKLPVVATHPVQFTDADDYEAHEARVCIAEGEILGNPRRVRKFTREQYFKSPAQMEAAVRRRACSAWPTRLEIAKRCNLVLELGKPQLPDFPTPNGDADRGVLPLRLASRASKSAWRTCTRMPRSATQETPRYVERLEFEIDTILKMGFPGYFLIVGDFINWAKKQRLPGRAGPGLGRRLAGGLCAQDHRPRPARIQPAVRAFPESRAGVDARLRHRLLPGQPRPRDRLRQGQVRQRRGEPDRHLRHHGRARRDPRRRPGAGHELHLLRRHQQADPEQAGPAHHDRPARVEGRADAGRAAGQTRRTRSRPLLGPGAEARRHDAQRRHARRRRADRAGQAHRLHARSTSSRAATRR